MNRRLLLVAFLSTLTLTIIAAGHQLTNAAPNVVPPPQHAPRIDAPSTATWQVVAGGGGKANDLTDVSMSSPADGWIVGVTGLSSYGVFEHFNGSTWSQTTAPTGTYSMAAVKMISSTEGWAVAYAASNSNSLLMHYTLAGWQKVPLPPKPGSGTWYGFSDLDMKGSGGWIVGDYQYYLQFTGASWTPISAPLPANAVSMVDANESWAVGDDYDPLSPKPNIAHWISGTWSLVTPTYSLPPNVYWLGLRGVDFSSAGEGWAVGYSQSGSDTFQCVILHYIGGTWSQVACPSSDVSLFAVAMRNPNDVWAVGRIGGYRTPRGGVIYHYNGSTWITATLPAALPILRSVELVGADDGWIVGDSGTILRLVNGTWTRVQGSNLYVGPISAVSANEVWYGGQIGQLYRWQNGTITQYTGPLTTSITTLDMISPTLGWGATSRPYKIFQYSNGTLTTVAYSSVPIYAIDMINPDEGWIGQDCGVSHYLSGTWTYQSGPNSYGATSLSMLGSNHGWGVSGTCVSQTKIVTYTNGTWEAVTPTLPLLGPYTSMKIIGISPGEAWVAGYSMSSAELYHYVGGVWTSIPVPDWLAFLDISKVSATEWWAAGKLNTGEYAFLHYKDGVFTTVPAAGEDVQQVSMLPDGTGFAAGVGSLLQLLIDLPNKVYLPLIRR